MILESRGIKSPGCLAPWCYLHFHPKREEQVRLKTVADAEARDPRQLRHVNMDRVLATAMDRPGPLTRAEITAATCPPRPSAACRRRW
jgi:hypothetical protein